MTLPATFVIDSPADAQRAAELRRVKLLATLVLAQLYNCFNARSDRVSAFHQMFANPLLWAAIALSVALQVAVVHVPLLNDAFDTSPLSLGQWAACAALASAVLWTDELRKLARRHLRPRRGRGHAAPSPEGRLAGGT